MDIHTVDSETFSVEDVVKAHMEDLAIQDKYSVTQLKYWVNVDARTLFCLMEGPDKEACNEVHKQSHGNTACNIIEVSDDEFNLFLGTGKDLNDLAQTELGRIDTGYRTILLLHYIDIMGIYNNYDNNVKKIIEEHNGTLIIKPFNSVMASFVFASDAMNCSLALKNILTSISGNFEINMALASGRPVDEKGDDLFQETIQKVQRLCSVGLQNRIYLDVETKFLSQKEHNTPKIHQNEFNLVRDTDFLFLHRLYLLLIENLKSSEFKSSNIQSLLGYSKSQAYRKISSLTGMAPNQLITELRLRQSLANIILHGQTIAEIAYDLGFNSPSYFTKVFRNRFGIQPTSFARKNAL